MSRNHHRNSARRPRREIHDLVVVDTETLECHIRKASRSLSRFATDFDISRNSLYRMLDGTPVRRDTVERIAEQLSVPTESLLESTPVTASPEELTSSWAHPEWEVIPGTQLLHRQMSNGLVMQVAKVRHRVLDDEFGRGKVYDIAGMPAAVREQCREALSRHALVSRRIGPSPFVAENLTLTSLREKSLWTAVDRWFDAHILAEDIAQAPLSLARSRQILSDVTEACEALHAQDIILRELHPDHILVAEDDHRCVLTDLELAKLLEVESTVSSHWQPNPYRAPEVAGGESHFQADLYSCARLLVHLITGTLPDYPDDVELLRESLPETDTLTTLGSCLSPNWKKRPGSIEAFRELLAELEQLNV